jgi:hypothetical protein
MHGTLAIWSQLTVSLAFSIFMYNEKVSPYSNEKQFIQIQSWSMLL